MPISKNEFIAKDIKIKLAFHAFIKKIIELTSNGKKV